MLPQGVWTHVAITTIGREQTIYINGVGSPVPSWKLPSCNIPGQLVRLGYVYYGTRYRGVMDNVKFWRVALTPGQILSTFSSNDPGTSSGLVVHLPFEENGGQHVINSVTGDVIGSVSGEVTWVPFESYTHIASQMGLLPSAFIFCVLSAAVYLLGTSAFNHLRMNRPLKESLPSADETKQLLASAFAAVLAVRGLLPGGKPKPEAAEEKPETSSKAEPPPQHKTQQQYDDDYY